MTSRVGLDPLRCYHGLVYDDGATVGYADHYVTPELAVGFYQRDSAYHAAQIPKYEPASEERILHGIMQTEAEQMAALWEHELR